MRHGGLKPKFFAVADRKIGSCGIEILRDPGDWQCAFQSQRAGCQALPHRFQRLAVLDPRRAAARGCHARCLGVQVPVLRHAVEAHPALIVHKTLGRSAFGINHIVCLELEMELRDLLEVTDCKALPMTERKRLQIVHAAQISDRAKLVKLADRTSNPRDMSMSPPRIGRSIVCGNTSSGRVRW